MRNHYEDIFAYWDSPGQITNAYTECLNGLIKLSEQTGAWYSYEIIRVKTLLSKTCPKSGRAACAAIQAFNSLIPTKNYRDG